MEIRPNVLGRSCGTCSMCCKVMAIDELAKPVGTWCAHVKKGRGCEIYERRPPTCAGFLCGYLQWPEAGEHWRPSKSKMVIVVEDAERMAIHVDESTPNAWRAKPYYDDLKRWAWHANKHNQQIVVMIGRRMIALLPDSEVDLGIVLDDEVVVTAQVGSGYTALKLKVDDPRVAAARKQIARS